MAQKNWHQCKVSQASKLNYISEHYNNELFTWHSKCLLTHCCCVALCASFAFGCGKCSRPTGLCVAPHFCLHFVQSINLSLYFCCVSVFLTLLENVVFYCDIGAITKWQMLYNISMSTVSLVRKITEKYMILISQYLFYSGILCCVYFYGNC